MTIPQLLVLLVMWAAMHKAFVDGCREVTPPPALVRVSDTQWRLGNYHNQ